MLPTKKAGKLITQNNMADQQTAEQKIAELEQAVKESNVKYATLKSVQRDLANMFDVQSTQLAQERREHAIQVKEAHSKIEALQKDLLTALLAKRDAEAQLHDMDNSRLESREMIINIWRTRAEHLALRVQKAEDKAAECLKEQDIENAVHAEALQQRDALVQDLREQLDLASQQASSAQEDRNAEETALHGRIRSLEQKLEERELERELELHEQDMEDVQREEEVLRWLEQPRQVSRMVDWDVQHTS
jgi:hypothetical protein